jgi:DNA-binding winged helix-turn-helix (wHTH) protein
MAYEFEGFTLDEQLFQLRRGDAEVSLRPQVFDTLHFLVTERHRVVSKAEIITHVWKGTRVTDNAVAQCIAELRRALGEAGSDALIRTVHGRGFRFTAEVAETVVPLPNTWSRDAAEARSSPAFAAAVLPFEGTSGDPTESELGRGIAENLIRRLARSHAVPIVAASSTWGFQRGDLGLKATGAKLGAAFLVEGRVRRSGSRLRVEVHLADTLRGTELWGDAFDADGQELFALEDEVAAAVTSALQPALVRSAAHAASRLPDDSLEGRLLFVRGLESYYRRTREDNALAISYFEREAAADPTTSSYHLGLAHSYDLYYQWSSDTERSLTEIARAAELCRRTSPRDAYGHMLEGLLHLLSGDCKGARASAELAVDASPSFAEARGLLGRALAVAGDADGALEQIRIAMRLSPRDPFPGDWLMALSIAQFVGKRYEEAAHSAEHAARHAPNLLSSHLLAAASLSHLGDTSGAQRAADRIRELSEFSVEPFRRLLSSSPEDLRTRFFQGLERAGLRVE